VQLFNAVELDRAVRKHPQLASWMRDWKRVIEAAEWHNLMELRNAYPATDGVPLCKGRRKTIITVFNAGSNDFRILTRVDYAKKILQIEEVMTDSEYSKDAWKNRFA
jgi:mRNA-degrading endonuclease HigB of HigAB toxin-antitoxin module